jgi:2-polyprenyl-3-methyl-5-hydroxy-6-metoxy-1,4-benzoquinol methylase
MRDDAIELEEKRLEGIEQQDQYPSMHERHRAFPKVFEDRNHKRIIDLAAGVGIVGSRIREYYPDAEIICHDICQAALTTMHNAGLGTVSFDIDAKDTPFPIPDNNFDAVISLSTIEHIIHVDHFVREIHRILRDGGHLYLSAPNYAGLLYLLPVVISGYTYHDPIIPAQQYEFYGHVRYFTYKTLLRYVSSFGFVPEAAYCAVPKESAKYKKLLQDSCFKAMVFKMGLTFLYHVASPRWASEPIICFRKANKMPMKRVRKVVL